MSWPLRIALAKLRPWTAASILRLVIVAAVVGAFLAGDYLLFRRLFRAIRSIEELQPFFALGILRNLLGTVLLLATGSLFFSSLTASIGAFFTDLDLEIYHSAPVSKWAIALRRWSKSYVQSSWLVTAFLLPLFAALVGERLLSPSSFLLAALALLILLSIPVSVAAGSVILLIALFPVRRLEQVAVSLGIMVFTLLVVGFRMTRPERLFTTIDTDDLRKALSAIELPSASSGPAGWLAGLLTGDLATPVLLKLTALAAAAFVFFGLATLRYYRSFVRSRESSAPVAIGSSGWIALADRAARPLPLPMAALIGKEVRTLVREAGQWSQLFMMAALVFLYLYNLRTLPLQGDVRATFVAYANLAMTGFIVSAMSVRFAYPAVSYEGKAFWILQSSPMEARQLLVAKLVIYVLPMTLLALVLTAFANLVLDAPPTVWRWTMAGTVLETITVVTMGIGLGGTAPDFKAENPLEVGLSLGGLTFMALSLLYVGTITILVARPLHAFLLQIVLGLPPSHPAAWKTGAAALTISLCLGIGSLLSAERRLSARA
jgi:ABC-2 type transport system permease protein